MSLVHGVACHACGTPRTADLTRGYEARSGGEQRGWLCQDCAGQDAAARRFAGAMRARHRGVVFFRIAYSLEGVPRRLVFRAPWTTP